MQTTTKIHVHAHKRIKVADSIPIQFNCVAWQPVTRTTTPQMPSYRKSNQKYPKKKYAVAADWKILPAAAWTTRVVVSRLYVEVIRMHATPRSITNFSSFLSHGFLVVSNRWQYSASEVEISKFLPAFCC